MASANLGPLEQLLRLNTSSTDFGDQLKNILHGAEYSQWVEGADGGDVTMLIDYLDNALDALDPSNPGYRKCLRELRDICSAKITPATSHTLSSQVLTVCREPVASGSSGDVYEGTLNGSKVCVKRVKVYSVDGPEKAAKALYQEAATWIHLKHKNIVPLLGITTTPLQLISEWIPGGELTKYIRRHPDANRLGLVYGVVEGLNYLHYRNIVHGDLKGGNILVDGSGHARITDFNLATVAYDLDGIQPASDKHSFSVRWTAPETLEWGTDSKEADVFSFAMVMIEAFTGAVPFRGDALTVVMAGVMNGTRPLRPTHPQFTDDLWELMQHCWEQDPHSRPEVSRILEVLSEFEDPSHARNETLSERTLENDPLRVNGHPIKHSSPVGCYIYNVDSSSSLSVWSLGDSMEIPPENAQSEDLLGQELIDRLDMTLDYATCPQERHELLNILCKMCSRRRMLPKSMHIGGSLRGKRVEADRGGHAVIFRTQHNNCSVAVKTIRITMNNDFDKCHSEFCREAVVWRHLRHPNILPLLGVDLEQHQLSMISEWMDQGNINKYVKRNGGVNRLHLLADAATGLGYMHNLNMVHGDLKGANILINQSHRACLADFGLSTIANVEYNAGANASSVSVVSKASLMSFTAGGTPRWMSPELLDTKRFGASDNRPTKKSDCYALGMVVYEVLLGNSPYSDITDQVSLIYAITEGYRPKKPDTAESLGFTNELWGTVQRCWLSDANARPDVTAILSHLNHATWSWERGRVSGTVPGCAVE